MFSSKWMSARYFSIAKVVVAICAMAYHYFYFAGKRKIAECPEGFTFTPSQLSRDAFLSQLEVPMGECFFPADYDEGAARFREAAADAGASIQSMKVQGLTTDVAILRSGDKSDKRVLVHISGTHGPEGYLGSAVQYAALKHLAATGMYKTRAKLPTIVFVHALNPFGFKHHRRVNEDNVDLNRNFLTAEEWVEVKALDPNYARQVDLQHIINPTSMPSSYHQLNNIYQLVMSGYYISRYGMNTLKTAMVAGNYVNPTGYSYGGTGYTASARNLMDLLLKKLDLPSKTKKLVLIDVHTGLGPTAVDTLLVNGDSLSTVERVFPTEYSGKGIGGKDSGRAIGALKSTFGGNIAASAVSKGYELTKGPLTASFCNDMVAPTLNASEKLCITQEFGTVSVGTVGMTAIADNYAWHHGSDAEREYYSNKLKGVFYVETSGWKRKTVHRGMALLLQAINHLSE